MVRFFILLLPALLFGQQYLSVNIEPGGMNSDIVESNLANYQHQNVWNLRIGKDGQWETVDAGKGYKSFGNFTNLKKAIEIYDEVSGDQFVVFYQGDSLTVVESPYGTAQWNARSKITMPSGVTIDGDKDIYWNYFNGVLRISNATSEPVWYGYIDRYLFESDATYMTQVTGWKAETCAISSVLSIADSATSLSNLTSGIPYGFNPVKLDSTSIERYEVFYFPIYDNGQYGMLSGTKLRTVDPWSPLLSTDKYLFQYCHLDLWLTYNRAAWTQNRLTGVGLVVRNPIGVYYLAEIIPITDDDETSRYVSYSRPARNHPTLNHRLTLSWPYFAGSDYDEAITHKEDGYLFQGAIIDIQSAADTMNNVVVDTVISTTGDSLMLATNRDLSDLDLAMASTWPNVKITLHKNWVYVPDLGFHTGVGLDLFNQATEYYTFADITAGVSEIAPDYKQIEIINGRSFVISNESDEGGMLRYSPLYQYDVLPNTNIIQTRTGDLDRNMTIINRDDRLVIMKRFAVEQGNVTDNYYRDVAFSGHGLYAKNGYMVLDNIVYIMDQQDLYAFDGNTFVPFMENTMMRQYYRDHVDTTSFLAYDQKNKELFVVLDSVNIVFQMDKKQWYERRSTYYDSLKTSFMDYDGDLVFGNKKKLVTFTTTDTTYGEALDFGFKTRVFNVADILNLKQLLYLNFQTISGDSVEVTVQDDEESRTFTEQWKPNASKWQVKTIRPRYFFREFYMTLDNVNDANNHDPAAKIRKTVAEIRRWH